MRPQRLVHHRERAGGQSVLAGPEHSVSGTQPAAVPQRGRDRDTAPGRHGNHAGGVAARDHHTGAGGQRQPVTGRQFRTPVITCPATRPEASTRLIP